MDYKKAAKEIWVNCIHRNIGSFTLTQEKRAIKDIEKYLVENLEHNYSKPSIKNNT